MSLHPLLPPRLAPRYVEHLASWCYTMYLFTQSDIKTIVIPTVSIAVLGGERTRSDPGRRIFSGSLRHSGCARGSHTPHRSENDMGVVQPPPSRRGQPKSPPGGGQDQQAVETHPRRPYPTDPRPSPSVVPASGMPRTFRPPSGTSGWCNSYRSQPLLSRARVRLPLVHEEPV